MDNSKFEKLTFSTPEEKAAVLNMISKLVRDGEFTEQYAKAYPIEVLREARDKLAALDDDDDSLELVEDERPIFKLVSGILRTLNDKQVVVDKAVTSETATSATNSDNSDRLGGRLAEELARSKYNMTSSHHLLTRTMNKIANVNDANDNTIKIVGMGSSVGVGAALTNAAQNCPVAKFTEYFSSKFNRLRNLNIELVNRSVSGSTLSDGVSIIDEVLATENPDILYLVYGMNDAGYLNYYSGQTFPFVQKNLNTIIRKAKAVNCDVIVTTTPHQLTTSLPSSFHPAIPMGYPEVVPAPVNGEAISPKLSELAVTSDWCGDGEYFAQYYLARRVNASMIQTALINGCPVINSEEYWFDAVRDNGEAALYDGAENVHPNILGHQLSYWRGAYDFVDALGHNYLENPSQRLLSPRIGVNGSSDSAVTARSVDGIDDIFQGLGSDYTKVFSVDHEGEVTSVRNRTGKQYIEGSYGRYIEDYQFNTRNVQSAQSVSSEVGEYGEIFIKAYHNGIGTQIASIPYFNHDGSIVALPATFNECTTALDVFTISTSGSSVVLTVAAAGTNFDIARRRYRQG